MLVLSRKLNEKIMIGDDVCITVLDIERSKIRLGIEAPQQVKVCRQELVPLAPGSGAPAPAARCDVCRQPMTLAKGYGGTGLCGPCATGEAATLEERGETW